MRTVTSQKPCTFDELSESAKEHALNRLGDINVDQGWWDFTYEDAENIGLEITSFSERDIDGGFHRVCRLEPCQLELCRILRLCDPGPARPGLRRTGADQYLSERADLIRTWPEDEVVWTKT